MRLSSEQRNAGVDQELSARNVAAAVRGKEEHELSNFLGGRGTTGQRREGLRKLNRVGDRFEVPPVGALTNVGGNTAGHNGIYPNSVARQLHRRHLREDDLAALGRGVTGIAG